MKNIIFAMLVTVISFSASANGVDRAVQGVIKTCDGSPNLFGAMIFKTDRLLFSALVRTSVADEGFPSPPTKIVDFDCKVNNAGPNENWSCKSVRVIRDATDKTLALEENIAAFDNHCENEYLGD